MRVNSKISFLVRVYLLTKNNIHNLIEPKNCLKDQWSVCLLTINFRELNLKIKLVVGSRYYNKEFDSNRRTGSIHFLFSSFSQKQAYIGIYISISVFITK